MSIRKVMKHVPVKVKGKSFIISHNIFIFTWYPQLLFILLKWNSCAAEIFAQDKNLDTYLFEWKLDNTKSCTVAILIYTLGEFNLPDNVVDRKVCIEIIIYFTSIIYIWFKLLVWIWFCINTWFLRRLIQDTQLLLKTLNHI